MKSFSAKLTLEEYRSINKSDYELLFKKNIDSDLEESILNLDRQFLHAKAIGFIHPITGEKLEFTSNLPQDLGMILKKLRNTNK